MDVEGVDEGEFTIDFLSKILGYGGMVEIKGGSVGIFKADAITEDPRVANAASRKSVIFET